jgi:hypothetical protein
VNILRDINICFITLVYVYYLFFFEAKAWWPMAGQVVLALTEVPPLVLVALTKKRKCGAKANLVLLEVEVGASDELPLTIRQSFKDSPYSHSTRMQEVEWQIMLEQFIASGVVVKNEVINIDSD